VHRYFTPSETVLTVSYARDGKTVGNGFLSILLDYHRAEARCE
jgi:hypothetical protein